MKAKAVITAIVSLALILPIQAQNILPHENFESGSLADWDETAAAVISSQNVRSGTYSARLTTGDLRDSFPTTPGVVHKVTGWVSIVSHTGSGWGGFRIEVTEAKVTAVSANGSFTVKEAVTPGNHGPVRVAANNRRYFECADGTPYLGTGHSAGLGAERYPYEFGDLITTVGPGNQQLFLVWIGGHLGGSAWLPWASHTLAYDGTVPPTGLDLAAAYGDGFPPWRLDAANPILFQGFMSGHAGLIPGRMRPLAQGNSHRPDHRQRIQWRKQHRQQALRRLLDPRHRIRQHPPIAHRRYQWRTLARGRRQLAQDFRPRRTFHPQR